VDCGAAGAAALFPGAPAASTTTASAAPDFVTTFQLLGDTNPRPIADWTPPLAGLLAAGIVAHIASPTPRTHSLSWPGLIVTAVACVAITALSAALVTVLGYPRPRRPHIRGVIWRTSATAIWFPPFAFFLAERSAWTFVAGAALVASLTRLLYFCRCAMGNALTQRGWKLYSALCISVCGEIGIVSAYMRWTTAAALLLSVAVAILTWRLAAMSAPSPHSRQWLPALAAVLLIAGGLTPYLKIHPHQGGGGSWSRPEHADPARPARSEKHASSGFAQGGDYAGVILWPEMPKRAPLVTPPAASRNPFAAARPKPLDIPFNGAYWYFQPPDKHPPPDSFVTHGNAAVTGFRSADHRPLAMEAHQNFGELIALSCCSRIQIAIANADRYPGTVSLELILTNTSVAGQPSQSLGTEDVTSTPRWSPSRGQSPVEQTLSFPIPARSAIRQFDKVTIRFHLDTLRIDSGARIAIEKFVLIPRGL
jgi:hypothetical protein